MTTGQASYTVLLIVRKPLVYISDKQLLGVCDTAWKSVSRVDFAEEQAVETLSTSPSIPISNDCLSVGVERSNGKDEELVQVGLRGFTTETYRIPLWTSMVGDSSFHPVISINFFGNVG